MSKRDPLSVDSIAPDTRARRMSERAAALARSGETLPAEPRTPRKRSTPRPKAPDLRKALRDFASARPQGWNHEDWLAFLEDLERRGHNISDREAIGVALEQERLLMALGQVRGIGPRKRQAIAENYGNLWQLQHADPEEISSIGSISLKDAERIRAELF